jgi:3-isopropylmalate dehydratase small subunit
MTIPRRREARQLRAHRPLPTIISDGFRPAGELKTPHKIVIAGRNFGCGSCASTRRSPWAPRRGAVIAESFAHLLPQPRVATGEL